MGPPEGWRVGSAVGRLPEMHFFRLISLATRSHGRALPRALPIAFALGLAPGLPSPALAAPSPASPNAPGSALQAALLQAAPDLDPQVLAAALDSVDCARAQGELSDAPPLLAIIDYSRPSTQPRLWVFDLAKPER